MLGMYANYVKERRGLDSLERDYGFAIYTLLEGELFIEALYIAPEYRNAGKAHELVGELKELAKQHECNCLVGNVDMRTNTATEALAFHLAMGQKLLAADNSVITTIQYLEDSNG